MAKPKLRDKTAIYEISGKSIKRKNRFCPRCGEGIYMARHSNRWSCGSCKYCEFNS
jgi:small subunit ribosomal protein S27Ae